MSNTYDQLYPKRNSAWIIHVGQLVCVKRNCFEQIGQFGIIIGCKSPNFGIGYDDDYWALLEGEISAIKTFQIYPVGVLEGELNEI